jgi:1,4-alpha-glucan branching enzyme
VAIANLELLKSSAHDRFPRRRFFVLKQKNIKPAVKAINIRKKSTIHSRPAGSPISAPVIVQSDPFLQPFEPIIRHRLQKVFHTETRLTGNRISLADFASGHEYFGIHHTPSGWVLREWAPNATDITMIGDFCGWKPSPSCQFTKLHNGVWELNLPQGAIAHGDLYKLKVSWPGGSGERLPAYARRIVQDHQTKIFCGQVWAPPSPYQWRLPTFQRPKVAPRIYEAHIGMAQEEPRIGTYAEFRDTILPRIVNAGYNTIQLMAVQEHPYYGSFGYHVGNYFAASSRFGTPEELKSLVDTAHMAGLAVIMDLVHSHSVKNETEGLSRFDGTLNQYFHAGDRGNHSAWDSRCFDYGKTEVLHFLLSNCRYWLDEFHFDGYRFDGVTSMLYFDHGLGKQFSTYADYFDGNTDEDALAYLALANKVIHSVRPDALTIAEDVSGMPGLAASSADGGYDFDYRLAMGTPDYWIKLIKETPDEKWPMGNLYHELTNRRRDEKTISYAESHDQALVGDQTLIFRLIDRDMYDSMNVSSVNLRVDRGIALHKMIRLITFATAGHGYLNFMGNEFGHPEWIDFPREGNHWSHHYARRQWHLRDDLNLRYRFLADFDKAMMAIGNKHRLLDTPGPNLLYDHNDDQILSFERSGLVFIFNFNPTKSFSDYLIPATASKYSLLLDSDSASFGGFGRLLPSAEYVKQPDTHGIKVYTPARTAMVLTPSGH